MDTKNLIIIFAALGVVGISMVVLGGRAPNVELQADLSLVGVALFTSGLTFFLVKVVD
jgi:hypothetical protein